MIKIAVVDPDPQFAEEIEKLLEGRSDMVVAAVALDLNQALIIAEKQRPQVMVIGPGLGADMSTAFVKKLTAEHPIGCVILAYSVSNKIKMAAMRANAVDVIQVPVDPEKIITAIKTAAGYAEEIVTKDKAVPGERKCAVITVFSTKGGVGKTVMATNLATSIARIAKGRVILVDLDLQFGDVGIALGLIPNKTMLEFANHIVDSDVEKIDELLAIHDTGLKVLLAPKDPESADLINGSCVSSTLSILKKHADFIIIDTPASFNDTVLAALDESDEICVIGTLDLLSLKNVKLCLKTLNELKYEREKQKMVINRVESNIGLKVDEVEKVLGVRAVAKIPSDKAVPVSINKGVPVVIDAPKLPVSREIEDLALLYVGKYQPDLAADWIDIRVTG